jgi:hypothetical protein
VNRRSKITLVSAGPGFDHITKRAIG